MIKAGRARSVAQPRHDAVVARRHNEPSMELRRPAPGEARWWAPR
jgi:hypothetical protein